MILDQEKSLLLVIDIQEKLLNAVFNKESLEKKSKILAEACSILNIPILITEQYPQGLGETIAAVKKNDNVFIKTAFNALEDENLLNVLNASGKTQIIVMGIETHICVHQTVSALLNNGFDVIVASDACGSREKAEYDFALDYMSKCGAEIKTTEMILFEFLKTAKHPDFKAIQSLIKYKHE